MSLLPIVRDLTNIPDTLVADSVIEHALATHRTYTTQRIIWHSTRTGSIPTRGLFEALLLLDADDSELDLESVGATVDVRGGILLDAPADRPHWRMSGWTYDVHMAAAIACDAAAAALASEYSFSTDGQSFDRASQTAAYHAAAERFRASAIARPVAMQRTDSGDAGSVGVRRRRG